MKVLLLELLRLSAEGRKFNIQEHTWSSINSIIKLYTYSKNLITKLLVHQAVAVFIENIKEKLKYFLQSTI